MFSLVGVGNMIGSFDGFVSNKHYSNTR